MSPVWTTDRPTQPGRYLCRFARGWEFLVLIDEGLRCSWQGLDPWDQPHVSTSFFDKAEWCVKAAPLSAKAQPEEVAV